MRFKGVQPSLAGVVHFVGIGGIGMSGIAMVMHRLGYSVQGSDTTESAVTRRLLDAGIPVFSGHAAGHVENAGTLVVSAAIGDDNPEIIEARRRRIPIMQRAKMLAEMMRLKFGIAVAGTHGKTTVTSLIAHLLMTARLDPTYVIGGLVKSSGESAGVGSGDYLVVEADESDGSFLHLNPIIAVVTNIDNDHLAAYDGETKKLEAAFVNFIERVPFYGVSVVCQDDHVLSRLRTGIARRFITYGLSPDSDVRASNIRHEKMHTLFEVHTPWRAGIMEVRLNLPGIHNVLNALAAIAVGHELTIDDEVVLRALDNFEGIARRFHIHPDLRMDGGVVHLVDDYGHHPTEIAATLETVDKVWPGTRKVVVFQPHRYTRTGEMFDRFVDVLRHADELILLDIYSAGERPLEGVDSRALCEAIKVRGEIRPLHAESTDKVPEALAGVVRDDDVVVVLGAGSVGQLAEKLTERFHVAA